jgi:hypothetical protein
MKNVKKTIKDIATQPYNVARRVVGGITGKGERNVGKEYRQLNKGIVDFLLSPPPTSYLTASTTKKIKKSGGSTSQKK